eukprot:7386910-Prymnesium_polylepis.2
MWHAASGASDGGQGGACLQRLAVDAHLDRHKELYDVERAVARVDVAPHAAVIRIVGGVAAVADERAGDRMEHAARERPRREEHRPLEHIVCERGARAAAWMDRNTGRHRDTGSKCS